MSQRILFLCLAMFTLTLIGCVSANAGGVVMEDGYAAEATFLTKDDGIMQIGARVSVGQVEMTDAWREKFGKSSERYALMGLTEVRLGEHFYIEPAIGVAYYPEVDNPEEIEGSIRFGARFKRLKLFIGGRYGFSNGQDHWQADHQAVHSQSSGKFRAEVGLLFVFKW